MFDADEQLSDEGKASKGGSALRVRSGKGRIPNVAPLPTCPSQLSHVLAYAPIHRWYGEGTGRSKMHKPLIVVPILVGGALMAMATAASAAAATSTAQLTGNDVLQACTDFLNQQFHKDPLSQGQCIGVIEALAFAAPSQPFQISRSCPPEGATIGQLITAVVSWMERRPEDLDKPFFALVLFALHNKWPCSS
jgi:hypothetical protein